MTYPLPLTEYPDHIVSHHEYIAALTVDGAAARQIVFQAIYPTIIDHIDFQGVFATANSTVKFWKVADETALTDETTQIGAAAGVVMTAGAGTQREALDLSAIDESVRTLSRGQRLVCEVTGAASATCTFLSIALLARTKRA